MAETQKAVEKKETNGLQKAERTRSGRVFSPATDIIETANEIVLLADMPGVEKDSIDVTLENNQLTIQGFVRQQQFDDHKLLYSEYDIGDYYRSFTLNDTIDQQSIEANYKNGVLLLKLPKAEKARARQIEIK